MTPRRQPWSTWLARGAWLAVGAALPWWLGLAGWLGLMLGLPIAAPCLGPAGRDGARRALRWGLPGVLLAAVRALGADAFAFGVALLGALAGYMLIVGLEAWLLRGREIPQQVNSGPEWADLALRPAGPPARIIELAPVRWNTAAAFDDPLGGAVAWRGQAFRFAAGAVFRGVGPECAFSPCGRWFAACLDADRGVLLWDRQRERRLRLKGWQLAGWQGEAPWLTRGEAGMPMSLPEVLGEDDVEEA